MKGLLKVCIGLAVIAAVGIMIGKVLGESGELPEEIEKIVGSAEALTERTDGLSEGAGKLAEDAGALAEDVGELLGNLLNGYENFEGYDIAEATMFDDDHPIMTGDQELLLETENAAKLDVELSGCTMEILEAEDGEARITAKNIGKLQVFEKEGTLYLKGTRKAMEDSEECSICLYLPMNHIWQEAELEVGAGRLSVTGIRAKKMSLKAGAGQITSDGLQAEELEAAVDAGEIRMENVAADVLNCEVGAGNLYMQGQVLKHMEADCSVGNMELMLSGVQSDYNYEISCVMGTVKLGEDTYSNKVEEVAIDNGAVRSMDVNCSVGNIEIAFDKE